MWKNEEDIATINLYVPTNRTKKGNKARPDNMERRYRQFENCKISILTLSNWKKTQQKIGKNKDLKSLINQFDLTNQYKIYNPMADEYFFRDHLGSWKTPAWIALILKSCHLKGLKLYKMFFFFFVFSRAAPWHMEVPRLRSNWSYSRWPTPQPQQTKCFLRTIKQD